MILVNGIKCRKCDCIVYSRATHDMRYCECGAIAIDGGREYLKVSGNLDDVESVIVSIKAFSCDIYDDWNNHQEKYGLIKYENQKKWGPMRVLYMEE